MGNNAKLMIATLVGTLVLVVGVSIFFSNSSNGAGPIPVEPSSLVVDAQISKGPATSPVTIVEFSDFQCPACASTDPYVNELLSRYPEVRFVYRHFPLLSIHPNAVVGAQAAEAALAQGKFWEMKDLLFSRQTEWANQSNPDEFFVGLARELDLDEAAFKAVYSDSKTRDKVFADLTLGEQMKVNATPTFFYNGEPLDFTEIEPRLKADKAAGVFENKPAPEASGEAQEESTQN